MKKPVILLDCDGVLADFSSLALQIIEEETGDKYAIDDIPRWDIFESLGYPELWKVFQERAKQSGFCKNISAYPAALRGVKKLRKNYEVLVVTAPVDAPFWMYERAHWIEDHFDLARKKVIFAHEKQHVVGDVFIDDKPENVTKWAEANPDGLPILWEHSYNQKAVLSGNSIRISEWNELFSILQETFGAD